MVIVDNDSFEKGTTTFSVTTSSITDPELSSEHELKLKKKRETVASYVVIEMSCRREAMMKKQNFFREREKEKKTEIPTAGMMMDRPLCVQLERTSAYGTVFFNLTPRGPTTSGSRAGVHKKQQRGERSTSNVGWKYKKHQLGADGGSGEKVEGNILIKSRAIFQARVVVPLSCGDVYSRCVQSSSCWAKFPLHYQPVYICSKSQQQFITKAFKWFPCTCQKAVGDHFRHHQASRKWSAATL